MGLMKSDQNNWLIAKLGGLDCRDQLRLRSRCLDMSRCPFSKCRDFLDMSRQLFELLQSRVSIETKIKIKTL